MTSISSRILMNRAGESLGVMDKVLVAEKKSCDSRL
jgi:hypothetical protein